MRPRRNRFGVEVDPGTTLGLPWGWRSIRCTSLCGDLVAVFEFPAGYLDELGPYVCGDCRTASSEDKAAA